MFVRAAPGLKIRDPLTKLFIPDEGCEVVESPYWTRALLVGDVDVVVPVEPSKEIE